MCQPSFISVFITSYTTEGSQSNLYTGHVQCILTYPNPFGQEKNMISEKFGIIEYSDNRGSDNSRCTV